MAFEHKSGISGAYDRSPLKPDHSEVIFREETFAQGADLNEAFSLARQQTERIGNLTAHSGDRIEGGEIIIDVEAQTAQLTAGRVYIKGDIRAVPAKLLENVPMTGQVAIGIRLTETYITHEDDLDLLGIHPGSEAEGEPGAARTLSTVTWGFQGDGSDPESKLFPVYYLQDGVALDQTPPPNLTGIENQLARQDEDANGDYIVSGCNVTALGMILGEQHFDIAAGVANVNGHKITRYSALRHKETPQPDIASADAETHTYGASDPHVITVHHPPIANVNSVLVVKEATATLTKGVTDSIDNLPENSIQSIESVVSGVDTYIEVTDYNLNGDRIDWTPGGDEPDQGDSYDVTYRYLDQVTPTAQDERTITVSGGVPGTNILVGYDFKMPRADLICLNQSGNSVYLEGLPSVRHYDGSLLPPIEPNNLLKLAEVHNTWFANEKPKIVNNGVRAYPFKTINKMANRLVDLLDLVALERLERQIDHREPVAKRAVFVDPFTDDRYRDSGTPQTAASFLGSLQLALDPTYEVTAFTDPIMLNYTEETIIDQPQSSGCHIINAFKNFSPIPGEMTLTPSVDYWTETQTEWLSPITRRIADSTNRTTTQDFLRDERSELIENLRQIDITFSIDGFAAGENLSALTFDGLDVLPEDPLTANSEGKITGIFTIPEGVPAGSKPVIATGQGGSTASNVFVGQGILNTEIRQRLITVAFDPSIWDGREGAGDPLAQTWRPVSERFITSVDLKFCAIGDPDKPVIVEIVEVRDGTPTTDIVADKLVNMHTVVIGDWHKITFNMPVYRNPDREYAFVVKTDDDVHSCSFADLGSFDAELQQFQTEQAYSIGVMLSSSNASTWTPHQGSDLTFRVGAAVFDPVEKTVDLGTFNVVDASDLMVRGTWFEPSEETRGWFEMELDDGRIFSVEAEQNIELDAYYTGTVQLRAKLKGTRDLSPVLFPGVLLISSKIRQEGTYVSRAFEMGQNVRLLNMYKGLIPAGSTVLLEVEDDTQNWVEASLTASKAINEGWFEYEHDLPSHNAPAGGRVRITLTGGPGARLSLADLRSVSI